MAISELEREDNDTQVVDTVDSGHMSMMTPGIEFLRILSSKLSIETSLYNESRYLYGVFLGAL